MYLKINNILYNVIDIDKIYAFSSCLDKTSKNNIFIGLKYLFILT